MATQTVIQRVRQGRFENLPSLLPGEFGYALDQKRLFIGNNILELTGTGTDTEFNFTVDLDELAGTYSITVDDADVPYVVNNNMVIFDTAPELGAVIKFMHNLEILSSRPPESIYDTVKSDSLISPAIDQDFPQITVYAYSDSVINYNDIEIRYTLVEGSNRRKGTLSIALNTDDTFTLNDSYTSNCFGAALDHVFYGTMNSGVFILNYTTTDSAPATMSWVAENFNAIV